MLGRHEEGCPETWRHYDGFYAGNRCRTTQYILYALRN